MVSKFVRLHQIVDQIPIWLHLFLMFLGFYTNKELRVIINNADFRQQKHSIAQFSENTTKNIEIWTVQRK